MFQFIVNFALKNRLLIVIGLIALCIVGYISLQKLNLDAFPDVTNIQVSVNTEAPGMAAEEVEKLISYPIESVMYSLPDVAEVRSTSKTGLSLVTIVFKDKVDIYFARQLVFERLQAAKALIPESAGIPEIGPNTSGLGQVFQYYLLADESSNMDAVKLRSLNDWVIKLLLMPVDGVTDVLSFGGQVLQYQVNVNPSKLLAYELSLDDVQQAIENNNQNAGGWYLDRGQEQLIIRGFGWLESGDKGLEQLRQLPIRSVDGTFIKVSDVATVGFGEEIRQGAVTLSTRDISGAIKTEGEVVSGIVLKRMGANTKQTIDGIQSRIHLIEQALPSGVKFVAYYDQADLVTKAVDTVVSALLLAFVLIVVVLLLFMMNLRAAFLVLISIPIAILIALMVMSFYGISANLMSLGGIAIAIGMLVDGSVVVVDNIFKKLQTIQSTGNEKEGNQTSLLQVIKLAANEVARPVFFAAIIIMVVFIPLFSFEGVEAKLFQPMAISIILAIAAAVLVALVIVPALASLILKRDLKLKQSPLLKPLNAFYSKALIYILKKKKALVTLVLLLSLSAATMLPYLGTEFVPELEEGTINLRVTLGPTASLNTALELSPKLEKDLLSFPQVNYALSRIGRPELGGDPEPVSNIEIYLGLKPVSEWDTFSSRQELQNAMALKLQKYPGLLLNFSQPIATRVDELLSGVKAQLAIKLFGPEFDELTTKGKELEAIVKGVEGTKDVSLEQITGEAQLVVKPRLNNLSRFGLSVADVMQLVSTGLGGTSVGQIIQGNERYDIYLRLEQSRRNNLQKIKDLTIRTDEGIYITLSQIADITIETGPPQIRRDKVQRRVVVQANVEGRDMGTVVGDIQAKVDTALELEPGYSVEIGGQFENQQRAQQKLLIVVPISILLIALLLYFAFGSLSQSLLILVNIPLALVGGVFALWLTGQYLSVPSSVGFITLFGVAVLNGVVMVEAINEKLRQGANLDEAVTVGALSRLRPVLMTALTSALGLIPMLLSSGVGSEIQKPLATVVVGGLLSATLLTLIVIPAFYSSFSKGFVPSNHK
ncbi:MAG: efflux RND transporter permease subunit [Gammaproteobacteria bacterium]|nr:efflux RND transporter permease subunit [Gammaproteobacteria bacterium]